MAVPRSQIASTRAFRRITADRVFGILGIIVIIIAFILVFQWEAASPAAAAAFPISWSEAENASLNQTGQYLDEPATQAGAAPTQSTQSFPFDVTGTNVTRVDIVFRVQDDIGSESFGLDQFRITILGPPGSNITATKDVAGSTAGYTYQNFSFEITPLPKIEEAPVATEAEAEAYVAQHVPASDNGTGQWNVTVELLTAGDYFQDSANSGQTCNEFMQSVLNCTPDPGNEFDLWATYYRFQHTVGAVPA